MAGRACPLAYRYAPSAIRGVAGRRAESLFVVGGMYGNAQALQAVETARKAEERATGLAPLVVFNGDFNWFNTDSETFRHVNSEIRRACEAGEAVATAGNVEYEIANMSAGAGCGCSYPEYVDDTTVERSNSIIDQLRAVAQGEPATVAWLRELPLFTKALVGGIDVGIVHGDAWSLSGWRFSVEAMVPRDPILMEAVGMSDAAADEDVPPLSAAFTESAVDVFACTHTCLPFAQDFHEADRTQVIINNGSAGMPNFQGLQHGIITRIATSPSPHPTLYGTTLGATTAVHVDALPLFYDADAFKREFLRQHPSGSPAHQSYLGRISDGPKFTLAQASRF